MTPALDENRLKDICTSNYPNVKWKFSEPGSSFNSADPWEAVAEVSCHEVNLFIDCKDNGDITVWIDTNDEPGFYEEVIKLEVADPYVAFETALHNVMTEFANRATEILNTVLRSF